MQLFLIKGIMEGNMRKAIEEVIRDFQNSAPVKLRIRELKIPKLPAELNKPFAFLA